ERNIASQRPSGEAPFNPSTVRFQALGRAPNCSRPINADPRAPLITTPLETGVSETKSEVTASSRGSNFGGEVRFGPGETRQRKPAPRRSAKSSSSVANLTRVFPPLVTSRPGPVLCKSQTPSCSLPAAANQRPSGEKAALKRREPRSSANSRCPPARSNAYSWTLVTVSNP